MSNRQITVLSAFPFEERERIVRALLFDRTTRKNILWGTDGAGHTKTDEMQLESVYSDGELLIQPRAEKAKEQQSERTKSKAEVFTPSWVCCFMNDALDEDWFGRKDVFHHLDGVEWLPTDASVSFPEKKTWKQYVDSRRLEITCGEAPFLVSTYDAADGSPITIDRRIGLLDRKLRVINENASGESEWLQQTIRAYQSVYGYEYQGDSLLIARLNLLKTFVDYLDARWSRMPDKEELRKILKIISWNLWQMDGLTDKVPFNDQMKESISLFDFDVTENDIQHCKIYDWRRDNALKFFKLKNTKERSTKDRKEVRNMKFDYIIGNPPYQDETLGDNKGFAPPIYDKFMDASYDVADKVELIHPARFLFNAGSTSKTWNEKMLDDSHFKVLGYYSESGKLFPGIDIKGGVVITYRDRNKQFGSIGTFTKYPELNTILQKVKSSKDLVWLDSIIFIQNRFNLPVLLSEHPNFKQSIGSDGKDSRFEKNIFAKIPAFSEKQSLKTDIRTLGIFQNKRTWRFIDARYVDKDHENLSFYKVVIPVANGTGAFGQALSTPELLSPGEAYTRSFTLNRSLHRETSRKNHFQNPNGPSLYSRPLF